MSRELIKKKVIKRMCNKNTQFSVAVKADKSGEYELNGSNGNQNHVRKIHQQIK